MTFFLQTTVLKFLNYLALFLVKNSYFCPKNDNIGPGPELAAEVELPLVIVNDEGVIVDVRRQRPA
jgi:hypothetical protein